MQWTTFVIVAALVALIVAMLAAATLAPIRLELSARWQVEGKFWAVAAGLRVLFVTISFAAAETSNSVLQLHVFGLRVLHRSLARKKPSQKETESKLTFKEIETKARRIKNRIQRWFDLDSLLAFIVGLRRYVRLERFDGRISYATPDVAITGMLAGTLYTFAGLLVPFGSFHVEPQWEEAAKTAGKFRTACKVYPGRAVLRVVIFVLTNIKLRQRPRSAIVQAQP